MIVPPILCYHKVDRRGDLGVTRLSPRRFAKQLERLAAGGWRTLSLDEVERCLNGERPVGRRELVITFDDAYRLQFASKKRRVAEGDRIVGYQASFTSPGARNLYPDFPAPMIGTLLHSFLRDDGATVDLNSDSGITYVENEVAYHKTVDNALETVLIPDASNPELKDLLKTGLKIFQGHEQHAEHVAQSLK